MPLTGKTTEEIVQLEGIVLAGVPDEGTIGNQALRESSGLDLEVYFAVRNRLRDPGRLAIRRGRGGSIRKIRDPVTAAVEETERVPEPFVAAFMALAVALFADWPLIA